MDQQKEQHGMTVAGTLIDTGIHETEKQAANTSACKRKVLIAMDSAEKKASIVNSTFESIPPTFMSNNSTYISMF